MANSAGVKPLGWMCPACGRFTTKGSGCRFCGHEEDASLLTNVGEEDERRPRASIPARAWTVLRWLLVIPAGMLAAQVAFLLVDVAGPALPSVSEPIEGLPYSSRDVPLFKYMAYVLVGPLAYIFAASRVAPGYRMQTSLVLAGIWGALWVYAVVRGATTDWVALDNLGMVALLACWVVGVVSGVAAVWLVNRRAGVEGTRLHGE